MYTVLSKTEAFVKAIIYWISIMALVVFVTLLWCVVALIDGCTN